MDRSLPPAHLMCRHTEFQKRNTHSASGLGAEQYRMPRAFEKLEIHPG